MIRGARAFLCGLAWIAAAISTAPLHAQTSPASEPRLALVIGNGTYRDQPLKNPVNDAKATAASLRKLGFTVIERTDAGKTAMEAAILEFGEKLRAGGVGLFYYAGHGIQSGGRNYLLPVDVTITTEASVRVFGVEASLVMDLMSDARNRANVVILDACRNNPFVVAVRGLGKGLAAIDAARGTMIAYSTAPGMVAADGDGANSPYTTGLLKALDRPGLKAEEVFKQVRVHVADATKGAQTPWESSSLTGDLVLNLNITINTPAAATAAGGRDPADVAFWNAISASNDPHDFSDYLKQFPNGVFTGLATRRLAEINRRQQVAAEEQTRRKAAEEAEKLRIAAEAEKKRLAALETEKKRQEEAERRRIAAEEAAKQKAAADAEKQRLAVLEAERQKKAAEEAARKRIAAEEAEKKRLAAEGAARQKQAAEEAARRTQQAALPPQVPSISNDPRQRAYDRVMGVLLTQTAQSGIDTGKRNDYRSAPKPKAIAACLDWSAGSADGVTVGAWASSWIPPGGSGMPPRRDAMQKCERGNNVGKQCRCAIVDEDDANVLELPKNIAVASAAPVAAPLPAATQQAALPPQAADPKAKWDGTWKVWLRRGREDYNGTATIKNGHVTLNAQASIYQMISEGDIGEDGSLKLILKFRNQPETYNLSVTFKGDAAEGDWGEGRKPAKFTRQ